MGEQPLYEGMGQSYAATRREDPRIARRIWAFLAPGPSVLNVGAGTGSYEPHHKSVVAVDPSPTMIRQRGPHRSSAVVQAVAERLPFPERRFDTAIAVLTVHHWADQARGLSEMRRVSLRQVVLFYEPLEVHRFWGLDYFPEAKLLPSEQNAPGEDLLRDTLQVEDVVPVPVPHDCVDGFGAAFWARPEAYLDPQVQAGMANRSSSGDNAGTISVRSRSKPSSSNSIRWKKTASLASVC